MNFFFKIKKIKEGKSFLGFEFDCIPLSPGERGRGDFVSIEAVSKEDAQEEFNKIIEKKVIEVQKLNIVYSPIGEFIRC